MATIYPNTGYAYNLNTVATTANSPTISPNPFGNLTGDCMINSCTFDIATPATTYNPTTASVTYGSSMDTELIEALFALKPKLRKKYKNDKVAFRKDVLAAAKAQEQSGALEKLSPLLDIEA